MILLFFLASFAAAVQISISAWRVMLDLFLSAAKAAPLPLLLPPLFPRRLQVVPLAPTLAVIRWWLPAPCPSMCSPSVSVACFITLISIGCRVPAFRRCSTRTRMSSWRHRRDQVSEGGIGTKLRLFDGRSKQGGRYREQRTLTLALSFCFDVCLCTLFCFAGCVSFLACVS